MIPLSCPFHYLVQYIFSLLLDSVFSSVFHVVDKEGNKIYDGEVIDRIEEVKCWHYLNCFCCLLLNS